MGLAVLLVESDFYQARDTQQALQHAGAKVLGPFGDTTAALRCIANREPSCAILDICLNDGVRFNLAFALRDKGVPILFLTGLDPNVIPYDLNDILVIQKPCDFRALLCATAKISRREWH